VRPNAAAPDTSMTPSLNSGCARRSCARTWPSPAPGHNANGAASLTRSNPIAPRETQPRVSADERAIARAPTDRNAGPPVIGAHSVASIDRDSRSSNAARSSDPPIDAAFRPPLQPSIAADTA